MAGRGQLEQMLRDGYAARVRGDVDGVLRPFTETARFRVAASAHASQVAMQATGIEELRALMVNVVRSFVVEDYCILAILIDGDRAAVHWHARFRSAVNGATLETDLCDLIEFEDGRIASFVEFCDTAAATQLLAPP